MLPAVIEKSLTYADGFDDAVRSFMREFSPHRGASAGEVLSGVRTLEGFMVRTDVVQVLLKVQIGMHISEVLPDDRSDSYGQQFMKDLREDYAARGLSRAESTLYEWASVASDIKKSFLIIFGEPESDGDYGVYAADWVLRHSEEHKRVYFGDLVSKFSSHRAPSNLYGSKENAQQKALGQTETGLILYNAVTEEGDEEAAGVALTAYETLVHTESAERATTPRSEEYLDFIRKLPCLITGSYPVDPCHTIGYRGTAVKASDFSCIPLTRELHMEMHTGEDTFWQKYGYNVYEVVANYLHLYITTKMGNPQTLTLDLPR